MSESFSDSSTPFSSSISDHFADSDSDSDEDHRWGESLSSSERDSGSTPQAKDPVIDIKTLQKKYDDGELDIPPYLEEGPNVLIIIDSNLSSAEYEDYTKKIRHIDRDVDRKKRPASDYILLFAMDDIEKMYDFCFKNTYSLRTYNGHPDKIRFLTNSNRASTCIGRNANPKDAGNNFIKYVREELGLEDAPILVYFFSNTSCLVLRDEKNNVFVTNDRGLAEPFIISGRLPKSKHSK